MEVKIKTEVTAEPVSLAEVKAFCHIDPDYSSNDDILNALISSSREKLEKELNLSFAEKTLIVQWNGSYMNLPYGPVREIVSVNPFDDDEISEPYTSYGLDFKTIAVDAAENCYIIYPVSYNNDTKLYNCEYVAGYETLPSALKTAMLIQIDYDYKNQGMQSNSISDLALQKAIVYSRNLIIQ